MPIYANEPKHGRFWNSQAWLLIRCRKKSTCVNRKLWSVWVFGRLEWGSFDAWFKNVPLSQLLCLFDMYCPILWGCRFWKINFIHRFLQEITLKALKMWKMVDHSNKSIVDEKNSISSKEQLTSKPLTGPINKDFWQLLTPIKSYFAKVGIFSRSLISSHQI